MTINPVLILHAPDANLEAALISEQLTLAGFITLTFEDVAGHSSQRDICETRFDLLEEAPAIIVLASNGLFKSAPLSEIAQMAKENKQMIPVIYLHQVIPPRWFTCPLNLKMADGSRGWNRLINALLPKVGNLFRGDPPEPPKPTIN